MRVYRLVQVVRNKFTDIFRSSATVYGLCSGRELPFTDLLRSCGTVYRLLRSGTVLDLFRSMEKAPSSAYGVTMKKIDVSLGVF